MVLFNRRKYMARRGNPQGVLLNIADSYVNMATSVKYTGSPRTPSVSVYYSDVHGQKLVVNKDYFLTYANNTDVGTATVTITGTGAFFGQVIKTFYIVSAETGYWTFSLGDVGYNPLVRFSVMFSTSGMHQVCLSDDETKLLMGTGNGYFARIGTIEDLSPSSFVQTAQTAEGINAGTTFYTPDGIHYLLATRGDDGLHMRIASSPYDLSTIPSTDNSYVEKKYIQGGSISSDGTKLLVARSYSDSNFLSSCELATPWDLTTATNWKEANLLRKAGPMWVNQANGRQFVLWERWGGSVMLGELSTPWDVTYESQRGFVSITTESDSIIPGSQGSDVGGGIVVNSAGTKMLLASYSNGNSLFAAIDLDT